MPTKAGEVLDQLGIEPTARTFADLDDPDWFVRLADAGHRIDQPQGLFPRIELPESEPAASAGSGQARC